MIYLDADIDGAISARARQRSLIEGRGPRVSEFLLNSHRFGGGGGDPNYSLRALGLHCDGSNGGTTFTDNSPTPKTVTPTICTTSTTQAKFGATSCYFPTSQPTEKLVIPHSADLAPLGDFTVAMWVYLTASTGAANRNLIWKSVATGHTPYGMRITTSNVVQCFASNAAGSSLVINFTGAITITTGAWHHIAFTRSGSTYRLFIDGVLDNTGSNSDTGYVNAAHSVHIGNVSDSSVPLGGQGDAFLDDILIYDGVALWTSGFTPPTATFADS